MDRLKKRVASSSSKVIASLSSSVLSAGAHSSSSTSSTPTSVGGGAGQAASSSSANPLPVGHPMSSEATAHLTEEERNILHKVFLKEQQFQRENFKWVTRPLAAAAASQYFAYKLSTLHVHSSTCVEYRLFKYKAKVAYQCVPLHHSPWKCTYISAPNWSYHDFLGQKYYTMWLKCIKVPVPEIFPERPKGPSNNERAMNMDLA